MPTALLKTKLHAPTARRELVSRDRLTNRMAAGLSRKMTLISGPAGSGKTTLVGDFISRIDRPSAWLSLDSADNDMGRFATYVVAALQTAKSTIGETVLAMLESPQTPPIESALTMLINDIASSETELLLVLDDYHVIKVEPIHRAISFLVEHQPANLHLVITSRSIPPLPLARLRARGELIELRNADLRFTGDEAACFLNEVMSLGLAADTVSALEARTEGWIAGLQLAALSIERRSSSGDFIKEFTGSHNYVLDYLVDEVIDQQSESIRSFLLKTSMLERMTGPLCEAVTSQNDGQATLLFLERANLFLVPLDDERRWFRYHHLFGEFLKTRLRDQTSDDEYRALHARAAEWFQENGFTPEAIEHAMESNQFDFAARLIEGEADELYSRGGIPTLQRWLERLPREVLRARPRAAIYYGWVLFFAGEGREEGQPAFQRAEEYLQLAEERLVAYGEDEANRDAIGMAYAVRTAMASAAPVRKSPVCAQRDLARTIQCGEQALTHLAKSNLTWRCVVNIGLGFAYRVVGDVAAATRAFGEASRLGHEGGNLSGALFAFSNCATLLIAQGRLREAEQTYSEALRVAVAHRGDSLSMTGQIYVGLGRLMYEKNELEEAERNLNQGLKRATAMGDPAPDILMSLARLSLARGEQAEAEELLTQASESMESSELHSHFASQAQLDRVRLGLARDDLKAAERWIAASGIDAHQEPNPWREAEYAMLARVLIRRNKCDRALAILEPLVKMADSSKRNGNLIELLIVKATALSEMGRSVEARVAIEGALTLAEPAAYVRSFVDEGKIVGSLVNQVYQSTKKVTKQDSSPSRQYLETLLLEFKRADRDSSGWATSDTRAEQAALLEPFSDRELEVIRHLAAGRSNQEIADELFVALSTIKWHINNIYSKLSVKSRTQAISRAQQLGLI